MPFQNGGKQGDEKREKEHENPFRRFGHKVFGKSSKVRGLMCS